MTARTAALCELLTLRIAATGKQAAESNEGSVLSSLGNSRTLLRRFAPAKQEFGPVSRPLKTRRSVRRRPRAPPQRGLVQSSTGRREVDGRGRDHRGEDSPRG